MSSFSAGAHVLHPTYLEAGLLIAVFWLCLRRRCWKLVNNCRFCDAIAFPSTFRKEQDVTYSERRRSSISCNDSYCGWRGNSKIIIALDFPGKTSYLKSNDLFDFSHRHP